MSLLERLVEEQRTKGLSDRAFARRLGVSQTLWTHTRSGKVQMGMKILAAVVREFPLLGNEVIKYLATYGVGTTPNSEQDQNP